MPEGYISLEEASSQLKVTRPTLYYYIKALELKTEKFPLDRKAYLPIESFETIKKWKEQASGKSSTDEPQDSAA